MEWSRQPNDKPAGVPEEYVPFDRPDQLNSFPHGKEPGEHGPEDTPMGWDRFPNRPEQYDDEIEDFPYDRRGDIHSIPRDGKPVDSSCQKLIGHVDRVLINFLVNQMNHSIGQIN